MTGTKPVLKLVQTSTDIPVNSPKKMPPQITPEERQRRKAAFDALVDAAYNAQGGRRGAETKLAIRKRLQAEARSARPDMVKPVAAVAVEKELSPSVSQKKTFRKKKNLALLSIRAEAERRLSEAVSRDDAEGLTIRGLMRAIRAERAAERLANAQEEKRYMDVLAACAPKQGRLGYINYLCLKMKVPRLLSQIKSA